MKSNQKVIRQRVEEIFQLRIHGALPTDIRRHGQEQNWGVSDRQLQRYTADADNLIAASLEKNHDKLMAHHFAARRALFARCLSVSDFATALRVLRDEAELLGLYPAKKKELTGADGGPIAINELTDEQRLERLSYLFDLARARRAKQANEGNQPNP
jgi:hypothetical protein